MNATELVQKLGDTLGATASVKSVFGDAIQANGRTIVPVARVRYGFGGGFGAGKNPRHEGQEGEGAGGGGGVQATPAGVLEITDAGAKFTPFADRRRDLGMVLAALAAGATLGMLIARRR